MLQIVQVRQILAKELTDKIKYALCPAVAAGDRRVLGGFKWAGQGRWWRKAAVGG